MEKHGEEIERLLGIIRKGQDENAFQAADRLSQIGGEELVKELVDLLSSSEYNTAYLAARALSKRADNGLAIEAVFGLIKEGKEPFIKAILTEALAGFDCSEYFVDVFKLYLFGNFKVSAMAKEILDDQEFAITPRVIRKAEKHWNHYLHNVKQGDDSHGKKREVESMFAIMKELFDGEEETGEGEE